MDDLDFGATVKSLASEQRVFDRFRLKRMIGRGGMGVVWQALDEKLDRDIALKFLPELVASDREAANDLKRETRRALDLTHPRIVRIFDFVQNERAAAISMEYVNGHTLAALKLDQANGHYETETLKPIVSQLCDALRYAHEEAKIIHRDLKPANLMLNSKGELKITDFGIAATLSDTTTRITRMTGTSGTAIYMSPQQMMGEKPAVTDDVYSLGATLYELLTGKPPFHSGHIEMQVQSKVPPSIADRRSELGTTGKPVPQEWESTIAACLAKDPAKRPGSVAGVAAGLGLGAGGAAAVKPQRIAADVPEARAPEARSDRKLLAWLPPAIVVLALLGAGYYYFSPTLGPKVVPVATAPSRPVVPANGTLMLKSLPSGAKVTIPGIGTFQTPVLLPEMPGGDYSAKVQLAKFRPETVIVTIVGGRTTDLGVITLKPITSSVDLSTQPPGAQYELEYPDGTVKKGATPAFVDDLPLGQYRVKFTNSLGSVVTKDLEVAAGETAQGSGEFTTGDLSIQSDPAGVPFRVLAPGSREVHAGVTPGLKKNIAGGAYIVEFSREGWPAQQEGIRVGPGETTIASHRFVGARYELTVTPNDAEVYLDGQLKGRGSISLADMPPGKHALLVAKTGYDSLARELDVMPGTASALDLNLVAVRTAPPISAAAQGPSGLILSFEANSGGGKVFNVFAKTMGLGYSGLFYSIDGGEDKRIPHNPFTVPLRPGRYRLKIDYRVGPGNPSVFYDQDVVVEPGKMTEIATGQAWRI